ncbi:hypothetical protein V6N13_142166 [Hibiscus sabdariffa]
MKPKDASKLGHDIETPHDLLKDSSDVVNSGLSHGAPSSIPSNLHLPPKKTKRIAEHEGFRDFCNMMQPRFQVPSRSTVAKDCMEIYLEEKRKLFKHKMDYVIFVIEEVYDEKKSDELSVLVKQTLNELFDHYSLLSGISKDESNVSSQSNLSRVESDELDLFAYSKSKYKRKRAESVFSEVQKEEEIEEMEDIESGFEDLRLNETTMTIDD